MLKRLTTVLAIIVISLSFSYGSFNNINSSSNNVYASSKHHKIDTSDKGIWQIIWDGIKDVQE